MTDSTATIPPVPLISLLVPGVGRVLALRTTHRAQTSELLVSDLDGQNVYINDIGEGGTAPEQYQLLEVGLLGEWMARPEIAPAVAAVLAHEADSVQTLGPLTFARAVQHIADNSCTAVQGIERALEIARACAESEARTSSEVRRLMGVTA